MKASYLAPGRVGTMSGIVYTFLRGHAMKRRNELEKYDPVWARPVLLLTGISLVPLVILCERGNLPFLNSVSITCLWLLAMCAVIVVAKVTAYRRLMTTMQRRDNIRCLVCDYDLQKNASGVCPECGNATAQKID